MRSYPSIEGGISNPPVVSSGRNLSIAAIAGRARKGIPFKRITIDSDNLESLLGKGIIGQPEIYQLFAHVNFFTTNVAEFVRVVDLATAKFPSLELKLGEALTGIVTVGEGAKAVIGTETLFLSELTVDGIIIIEGELHVVHTITDDTHLETVDNHIAGATSVSATKNEWVTRSDTYDTTMSLATSGMIVSLDDGSDEEVYGMSITDKINLELYDGTLVPVLTMGFHEKIAGTWEAITGESYTVSLNPNTKNDRGESLYWPTVLNDNKSIFKGLSLSRFLNHAEIPVISTPMGFVGAAAGSLPDTDAFQAGWDLFDTNDSASMMAIVPNSDITSAIYAIKIFYEKHALSFYSIPGTLSVDGAVTHRETLLSGVGNKRRFLVLNYGPISVNSDPFFGLPMDLDWDGAMTGACAFGDSGDSTAGDRVGIHSQPAGETRGLVSVYGIAEPKYALKHTELSVLGDNDINFLTVSNTTGACKIAMARTQVGHNVKAKERLVGVQRTQGYMLIWFLDYLEEVQHEADAVTKNMTKRGGEILRDALLATDSIHLPDEDEIDGDYTDALTTTFIHNSGSGLNDIGLSAYITGSSENFKVTVMSI